jgi:hypothetical protein
MHEQHPRALSAWQSLQLVQDKERIMANKTLHTDADSPYAPGKFDLGAMQQHRSNWTDGFPHEFKGWGPQTPDPAQSDVPATELVWEAGDDHAGHYVWRFDLRRRH